MAPGRELRDHLESVQELDVWHLLRQLPLLHQVLPDRGHLPEERGHDLLPGRPGDAAGAMRVLVAELPEEKLFVPNCLLNDKVLYLLQRWPTRFRFHAALHLRRHLGPRGRGRIQQAVLRQNIGQSRPGRRHVLHGLRALAGQAAALAEQHAAPVAQVPAVVAGREHREASAAVHVGKAFAVLGRLVSADDDVDPVRPTKRGGVLLSEEVAPARKHLAFGLAAGLGRVGPEHVEEEVVVQRVQGAVLLDCCHLPVQASYMPLDCHWALLAWVVHGDAAVQDAHGELRGAVGNNGRQWQHWEDLRVAHG
mmetsp:Transcript_67729/g.218832  ORF Transcript_67729/g.218832 Transcript_67729/m.218832 type:complete len:308 (+) Transcript_67729:952-1875(+)